MGVPTQRVGDLGQAVKAVVLQLGLGTAGAGDALHLAAGVALYFGGLALGRVDSVSCPWASRPYWLTRPGGAMMRSSWP